jgi:parallel beta-helix repeat protein
MKLYFMVSTNLKGEFEINKKFLILFLTLILGIILSGTVSATEANNQSTTINSNTSNPIPDPYNVNSKKSFTTIQDAIDDPETIDGDTIMVEAGNYYENIVINKNLTLLGVGTVNIMPVDPNLPCIFITSDGSGTLLKGFCLYGSGSTGIYLDGENCSILNNCLTAFDVGIDSHTGSNTINGNIIENCISYGIETNKQDIISNNQIIGCNIGIYGVNAEKDQIFDNKIKYNVIGISGTFKDDPVFYLNEVPTIRENIIDHNTEAGIKLASCIGCSISNNTITNNGTGVDISDYEEWNCNAVVSNTITGNTNGVIISSSKIVEVLSNEISNNSGTGIMFKKGNFHSIGLIPTYDSAIRGNNIENNGIGIYLWGSSENSINLNIITGNDVGVFLSDDTSYIPATFSGWNNSNQSSDNYINHNNIYQNGIGFKFESGPGSIPTGNHLYINRIVDNTTWNVLNNSSETVDAYHNWWGSNSSPASTISGDVIYDPWFIVIVNSPSTVNQGSSAPITVDMNYDSNYEPDTANWLEYPDSIVYFSTDNGSIVPSQPLKYAKTTAYLTIPLMLTSFSPAHVKVTMDHVTITKTLTINPIKISQVALAANSVKNYYDTYHKLPPFVYLSGNKISMAQYLQLMSLALLKPNGFTIPSNWNSIITAINPQGTINTGNLTKTELLTIANNVKNFINTNSRAPNYVNTSLGRLNFNNLVYTFAKTVIFYQNNQRMPNYVGVRNILFS